MGGSWAELTCRLGLIRWLVTASQHPEFPTGTCPLAGPCPVLATFLHGTLLPPPFVGSREAGQVPAPTFTTSLP